MSLVVGLLLLFAALFCGCTHYVGLMLLFEHKTFEGVQVTLGPAPTAPEPVEEPPDEEDGSEEPPASPEAVAERQRPPKGLQKGDDYPYTLSCPLNITTYPKLAEVIRKCQNGGTKHLRLIARDGQVLNDLPEWKEFVSKGPLLVNDQQFFFLAQAQGL